MSYFMDYGDDWPPRPPRPRVFGREFFVRAALICTTFVILSARTPR